MESLERLTHHNGYFLNYGISAFKYRRSNGSIGWHLTAWDAESDLREYWFENGQFQHMRTHILDPNLSGGTTFQMLGPAEPIEQEKAAVFAAVAAWSAQMAQN